MASKRNKFVLAEVFSNSDGKSSASALIGILVGIVGCIAFTTAIVGYIFNLPNTINVMQQSTIFIGAATALLAARKFAPGATNPEVVENVPVDSVPVEEPAPAVDPNIDPIIDNTPSN
jgi:hypothetical protein